MVARPHSGIGLYYFSAFPSLPGAPKNKEARVLRTGLLIHLLTRKDSNLDRQNQNLQCYRYTTGQYQSERLNFRAAKVIIFFLLPNN
jgi:hypothetical protein